MPQRFVATENAFDKGIENVAPAQGAKLAADWVTELRKADFAGSKGLADDLERLERLLKDDEPDGEKIGRLLDTIGEATAKAADRAEDERIAEKVRNLASAIGAKQSA